MQKVKLTGRQSEQGCLFYLPHAFPSEASTHWIPHGVRNDTKKNAQNDTNTVMLNATHHYNSQFVMLSKAKHP